MDIDLPDPFEAEPAIDLAGEYTLRQTLGAIQTQLDIPGTTEVCVNRPGVLDVERNGVWLRVPAPELTLDELQVIAILAGNLTGKNFGPADPIVYTRLPRGERLTIVGPPVVAPGLILLVIRRREKQKRSFDELCDGGLFDDARGYTEDLSEEDRNLLELYDARQFREFMKLAVAYRKNIGLAGKPGSGKTTVMEAMTPLLPLDWRLITVEDTPEVEIPHENKAQLFFDREAKGRGQVNADRIMALVLRMYGMLVLFGELRGEEALPYMNCIFAGNPGITTFHAGSVREIFSVLPMLMRRHPAAANIRDETLRDWTYDVMEVAAHFRRTTTRNPDGTTRPKFRCTEVYFKAAVERDRLLRQGGRA